MTSLPTLCSVHGCAADYLVWRDPSRGTFVAVVAKIAFAFVPGETASLLPPAPLVTSERHRDRSTMREVEAASDAAPFLSRPEVLVVGHAYAPAGRSAASAVVHVSLGRETVTFRKTLHVYGDRETSSSTPVPFRRVPLSWERAVRGEANPVGIDPSAGAPNLVDPQDPTRPAGLGPIAAIWPPRQMRRHGAGRSDLESEPLVLPTGFDGSFFLAAPPDQWLDQLSGDEWVSLDGLHPQLPRVQTRLPGMRVGARFEGPRGGRTVELRPDRLVLDSDRQRGTLSYRGSQAIEPAELGALRIFVGLAAPGQPVTWPDRADPSTLREHVLLRRAPLASPVGSPAPLGDTATFDDGRRAFVEAPPLAPPMAPPIAVVPGPPARLATPVRDAVPRAHVDEDDDDGSTRVADAASLLAARAALPFGAPLPPPPPPPPAPHAAQPSPAPAPAPLAPAVRPALPGLALPPPSPVQKTHVDDDDTSAATGMVDMSALLASQSPFGPDGLPNLAGLVPPAALTRAAAPPPPAPRDQLETLAIVDPPAMADVPAETRRLPASGSAPATFSPPPPLAPPDAVAPMAHVAAPAPAFVAPPASVAPPPAVVTPAVVTPAVVTLPAAIAPPAPVAPPAAAAPAPPAAVSAPAEPPPRVSAPTLVEDETTYETAPHPAVALPFVVSKPTAPSGSAGAVASGGLPFVAPPTIGTAPAVPAAAPADPEEEEERPGDDPRGEAVRTLADGPLAVTTIPWQIHPPKDALVVVVKGSFDLVPAAVATIRAEPALFAGDVFADDEPTGALRCASDFAIMKPHCDVLFHGHALAPGGVSTAMQVVLKVKGAHGRVDKTLHVFGDRTWQRAVVAVVPSEPAPFEKLPMTWERSFGGPELVANPHGVGHRARPGPDGVLRLPNFEAPGQQIKSPDDTPQPASLAPVHPLNKARWSLLGTYDKAWFKERWPYFPKDFDYAHFQSAPPQQRLERAVGDEEYELVGLVAGHPKIKGRLPSLKVRAFGMKTAAAGGKLVEIPLKLDTITFVGDEARVDLVWRGHLDVTDDDAPELERIFVTSEPLGGPALLATEIRARYERAVGPPVEVEPGVVPLDTPPPPSQPDTLADEIAEQQRLLAETLRAKGIDLAPDAVAPPPPRPEDLPKLAETLRATGASEADVREVLSALQPPPPAPIAEPLVDLRKLVAEHAERGETLAGLVLRNADLRDLDLAGADFTSADLSGARLDRASLEGAKLDEAILTRASLRDVRGKGASFARADLTGAVLDGADLEGAKLGDATCARASAIGASLRGASAPGAVFTSAKLDKATFAGATLTKADFTRARLDGAVFDAAVLAKARFYDARGAKVRFVGCDLRNLRAEGAMLTESSFEGSDGDDSIWERAELTQSTFAGTSLVSASFLRAKCWKTSFNEADLTSARLRKAEMKGASFVKANLFEANLERANFELADLRGSNLHGAAIVKTDLAHAKLDHAITSYSALGLRQP